MDDPTRGRALNPPANGDGGGSSRDGRITDGLIPDGLIPDGLDATLVLVRHGESQYIVEHRFQGQADTPLTARGRRQAELAGARLAAPHDAPALPIPVGAPLEIVHSPLARTRDTAAAISSAMATAGLGGPSAPVVRADAGFLEIGQGEWEGLHRDEIAARYGDDLAAWRRRPTERWATGGESLAQVADRARPALGRVLSALAASGVPGSRDRDQVPGVMQPPPTHPWTVIVAHDGVFKVSLLTLFDLPLERFWMWSMDLCGISVIEFRAGQPVVRAYNLTGHLATLLDDEAVAEQEARSRSGAL